MSDSIRDRWAEWLLHRRHGGDPEEARRTIDRLGKVRDRVLDNARALAERLGVLDRCRFVRAPAEDLALIADASVDVVTTRSVLAYVGPKRRAFGEFARVLKPGGRIFATSGTRRPSARR